MLCSLALRGTVVCTGTKRYCCVFWNWGDTLVCTGTKGYLLRVMVLIDTFGVLALRDTAVCSATEGYCCVF